MLRVAVSSHQSFAASLAFTDTGATTGGSWFYTLNNL